MMMEDSASTDDGSEKFGLLSAAPRARVIPVHVGLAVLIAGLVLLALLVNSGILTVPPQYTPALEGSPFSYSEALKSVQSLVSQEPGGPWRVSSALGLGTALGLSGPARVPPSTSSCSETLLFTGTIEFPATPKSAPPGYVSSWSIGWAGAQGGLLDAVIWNTSVLTGELISLGSGNCTSGGAYQVGVPEPTLDSPNATIAADRSGGDAWLFNHESNETFLSLIGPNWLVTYSTCSAYQLTGYGLVFSASVNASTGVVNSAYPSAGYSCADLWGL